MNHERHRHDWIERGSSRACGCGAMQIRTPAGRWRNATDDERALIAAVAGYLFALTLNGALA